MKQESRALNPPAAIRAGKPRVRARPNPRPASGVRRLIYQVGGLAAVVVVWQFAVEFFRVPAFLLPPPTALARGIVANWSTLYRALRVLLPEAMGGFVAGNTAGILLAFLVSRSPTLRAAILPMAVTIRSIPIVAITPLITLLLGFGYATTVTVAALICFFPTFVNVSRGLEAAPVQAVQFFRLLDAGEWDTFWKLRFPAALPFLFTALRVTGPASIIGAMVAEFIASDAGLGFLILLSYSSYRFDVMWQAIILTTLASVAVFALVSLAERLIIPWHRSE